jgi:hypothetical protein
MSQGDMRRIIADAGYEPVQRRTLYDACSSPCCTGPIPEPKEKVSPLAVRSADIDSSVASA